MYHVLSVYLIYPPILLTFSPPPLKLDLSNKRSFIHSFHDDKLTDAWNLANFSR